MAKGYTPAGKAVDKTTRGPAGTAAQRASKTTTRGREQSAATKAKGGKKLPNSQGK